LDHALRALGDGAGHEEWGPAIVANTLYWSGDEGKHLACRALDISAVAALATITPANGFLPGPVIPMANRERYLVAIRAIAPVVLEQLLGPED
jgi:hypothetical protein